MPIHDIKKLNSGDSTTFFTKGDDVSFLDVADEIFNLRPPECNVFFASWRIGKRDIVRVKEMAATKGVSLRLLLDVSMQSVSRRGEWDMMKKEIGSSVWLTKNHAKIFAMSPDWLVITSANLNRNSRLEVFNVARSRAAYETIKNGLAPFFAKKPAIVRNDRPLVNDDFEQFEDESGSFATHEAERVYLSEMIVSTEQAAEFFGVTAQAVTAWARNGCPKLGRGKWDLRAVHSWWIDNIYASKEDAPEMQIEKTKYWQAKARVEKVKADEAEGAMTPTAELKEAWTWRVVEVRNRLLQLPLRLSAIVAGLPEPEIRARLQDEIWNILTQYARPGEFCPPVELND